MESIGKLLAGKPALTELKTFRVRLARYAFYEVEVAAENAQDAMRLAEKSPPAKPTLLFHTEMTAHGVETYQHWDKRWVKVELR